MCLKGCSSVLDDIEVRGKSRFARPCIFSMLPLAPLLFLCASPVLSATRPHAKGTLERRKLRRRDKTCTKTCLPDGSITWHVPQTVPLYNALKYSGSVDVPSAAAADEQVTVCFAPDGASARAGAAG